VAEGEAMRFEDALKRLETIVREMETSEVPLDRAIALFEEGQKLKALCEAQLAEAETRIRELQLDAGGQPVGEKPFSA
jgi:exodeoxyribonuclease VII small subunit